MSAAAYIASKLYYARKDLWRRGRILFPSPAELQFIRVMGGRVILVDHVRHPDTGFSLAVITSMGKTLRREFVQREMRVGAMYVDFAFVTQYSKKAVEIDGKDWHRDVVREQQRDDYLRSYGWNVLHIQAADIYSKPKFVRDKTITFLSR